LANSAHLTATRRWNKRQARNAIAASLTAHAGSY